MKFYYIKKSFNSETIKIPFALNSNTENQAEYIFSASDCTFPQKLKGTLTYMLKVKLNGDNLSD